MQISQEIKEKEHLKAEQKSTTYCQFGHSLILCDETAAMQ